MKTANLSDLVGRVGRRPAPPGPPDAELLSRFLTDRDEQAFTLIVRRHGPLVLGVCRRVTGDHHLAEDAFQAVFVVLAAKAGSVRPQSALPAWLYGVAYRIALRARTMSDRRRRRETSVETVPELALPAADEVEAADLAAALDEEIARLPEDQRAAVVLCELEGRSRQDAAARLGISEGTLSSRLARARRALAGRLRRRGVALTAAGLTAAFARLAPASVPGGLVSTAVACATGPGPVPASVAALSHGVLRVMFIQKLKVLALASGLIASALFAAERLTAANPPTSPASALSAEPASHRPDQPTPKPAAGNPLPQGPNKLLVLRAGHLVLTDPDGKNGRKVTPERLTFYRDARLSPDGKTVALVALPKVIGPGQPIQLDPQKLFIRALDEKGAGVDLDAECKMFAWSPDGSEIACNQFAEGPKEQDTVTTHFVVNVRTKEKTPLKLPDGHFLNDWSRDGKYFLTTQFSVNKEQPKTRQARLYLMNRDGTEHKALTDENQFCVDGRFSPDGKRVLYGLVTPPEDDKGEPRRELAVVQIETGKSAVVGNLPPNCVILGFCWAPDGTRIAYTWREVHAGKPEDLENKETKSHLVVCDPDGNNARTIATEKGGSPWEITIGRVDWR